MLELQVVTGGPRAYVLQIPARKLTYLCNNTIRQLLRKEDMMGKDLFCLALIHIVLFTSAFAQWTQTNGPEGGEAKCLMAFNDTLYVGTEIGVFQSTDHGAQWNPAGLRNTIVASLAARPTGSPNLYLFAGTWMSGAFRSSDNGASWVQLNSGLRNRNVMALAVRDTILLAGTDSSGVFLSPSNGDYWMPASDGLTDSCINALTVIDRDIYAGTNGGLFRSTNGGAHWALAGLMGEGVGAVAIIDTNLFAATDTSGVMRSTDRGASWTKVSNPDMGSNACALAVVNGSLYAATYQGVYRTPNYGGYWISCNTGLPNSTLLGLCLDGTDLYAGTVSGVYRSTNSGASWTEVNVGLKTTVVYALAGNGADLYTGTRSGLFRTNTGGSSWTCPGVHGWTCSIAINGVQISTGTWGHVISSLNNGANWDFFPLPGRTDRVFSLAGSGNEVLVGTESDGVSRFTHNAPGWCTITSTTLTDTTVYSLAANGTDVFAGTEGGIFHSTNGGRDWTPTNNGLTDFDVRAMTFSGSTLFAGTSGGSVFRSTDNGTSWTAVNSGLESWAVLCFAVIGNNLFAGTWQGGIYLSTNNGESWTSVNTGLMTSVLEPTSVIPALAVVGSDLYAGTYGAGVWRRPLSEMVTSVDMLAERLPHEVALQQNYPNPFNPTTTIRYALPRRSHVTLTIYNALGQQLATLVDGEVVAGRHEVKFDGEGLPSGVYFYRFSAGGAYTETKKLVLLR